jgi:soluble lytic murein transglycosylase-like protein
MSIRSVLRQGALAVGAATALVMATIYVRPIPQNRTPVVAQILRADWRDSVAQQAPWADSTMDEQVALTTPQFEADRKAFAADLVRTGNVDAPRADSLATFAVREAYVRHVPPALVFGVMMTEDGGLVSSARSKVGAVGLMQIDPKAWVRSLGRHFGTNLRNDETNLRYGVYILSHLIYSSADSLSADSIVRRGLLRYNGCVRGTNTPNCKSYPDVVRSRIEQMAVSQCGDGGYDRCVAKPMQVAMGDTE